MKYRVFRATNNQPIDEIFAPGVAFQVEEIRVHLSAGGAAADLTVTLDSGEAVVYDVVMLTQDMNAVTDLVYQPDRPHMFGPDDELVIEYSNVGSETWGLEIYYSAI